MQRNIHSGWLSTNKILVRGAWALLALLILIHLGASLPVLIPDNAGICQTAACTGNLSALAPLGITRGMITGYFIGMSCLFVLICVGLSALLLWRAAEKPMALYTAFTLVTFGGTAFSKIDVFFSSVIWAGMIYGISWLGQVLFLLFFCLFPDGIFVPRWTRIIALLIVCFLLGVYFFLYSSLFPGLLPLVKTVVLVGSLLYFSTAIFAQIYRYRCISNAAQRKQTVLVATTLSLSLLVYACFALAQALVRDNVFLELAGNTLIGFALLLFPLSLVLSILRDKLWEMNVLLNRTFVYGALTACVVSVYILVVGTFASFFQTKNNLLFSLLATGCVAVLIQPLRTFLQRRVNHLMYGERDHPVVALSRLGQQLEATLAPDVILQTIAETVAQALKLPYAALQITSSEALSTRAAYGTLPAFEQDRLLYVPLNVQNEQVGALLLAPRAGDEGFSETDKRLLREFAYQAGLAVRAIRLSSDLQRVREQLVLAREEERRRIRRDLHDGLAPTLASLALSASILADLLPAEDARARQMAGELESGLRASIGDIRRLVYALRPPALDELGLVAALHEYVNQQARADAPMVQIQVTPETLPALPAAVEVAALRIAQEAFMNVLRHAQANHCRIQLICVDELQMTVSDDGRGIPTERHHGVGLLSMRERAAELGGSCTIESKEDLGTSICVRLPLTKDI